MNSFDQLDVVTKEIFRLNNEIKIKHIVYLNNTINNKKYEFYYEFEANNKHNLYLKSKDQIVIESIRPENIIDTKTNGGKFIPPPRIYISYMNAPLFIISFDRVITWLTSQNKEVFESNDYGSPIKIKKKISEIIPSSFDQMTIFEPTIVYDDYNVAYQGVKLSNRDSVVGNFTAQEFLEFTLAMKNILSNLYLNSNILTMIGMLYMLGKRG